MIGAYILSFIKSRSDVDYWEYLKDDPSRWPQLYLFSKSDDLIPSSDVSAMLTYRRSLGVDVSENCWENSPHVQHMRTHRETYINSCHNFLERCKVSQQ